MKGIIRPQPRPVGLTWLSTNPCSRQPALDQRMERPTALRCHRGTDPALPGRQRVHRPGRRDAVHRPGRRGEVRPTSLHGHDRRLHSAQCHRIRPPGWSGRNGPPPSVPTGNCPATTTPTTRSARSPPQPTRTKGPPGTRLWPPSAPSTARTCAACPMAGCCTYATPTRSRPPGLRSTSGTSCGRSAPPPGKPGWQACAPPPTLQPPTGAATTTRLR